jgi:hypothetical protein
MANMAQLLQQFKEHLEPDEVVSITLCGAYEVKILGKDSVRTGILVATDRQVVFYAKKMFGYDMEAFSYAAISSIEVSKGFMGHAVTFFASGNKATLKWISEGDVTTFCSIVKQRIQKNEVNTSTPTSEGIPELIQKLAALHNAGVLSDEEFQTKKTELLSRL